MNLKSNHCFVDSSAFIALYHVADRNHKTASHISSQLNGYQLVISEAVLSETYNILRYRLSYRHGHHFLNTALNNIDLEISDVTHAMRVETSSLLEKFSDHKISYCDALSVIIMREKGVQDIFAFDHHFEMMGVSLINHKF